MSPGNKKYRDGSKTEKFVVRISREDREMLSHTSEKMGISMSDVIRNGISGQYDLVKYKS